MFILQATVDVVLNCAARGVIYNRNTFIVQGTCRVCNSKCHSAGCRSAECRVAVSLQRFSQELEKTI